MHLYCRWSTTRGDQKSEPSRWPSSTILCWAGCSDQHAEVNWGHGHVTTATWRSPSPAEDGEEAGGGWGVVWSSSGTTGTEREGGGCDREKVRERGMGGWGGGMVWSSSGTTGTEREGGGCDREKVRERGMGGWGGGVVWSSSGTTGTEREGGGCDREKVRERMCIGEGGVWFDQAAELLELRERVEAVTERRWGWDGKIGKYVEKQINGSN